MLLVTLSCCQIIGLSMLLSCVWSWLLSRCVSAFQCKLLLLCASIRTAPAWCRVASTGLQCMAGEMLGWAQVQNATGEIDVALAWKFKRNTREQQLVYR